MRTGAGSNIGKKSTSEQEKLMNFFTEGTGIDAEDSDYPRGDRKPRAPALNFDGSTTGDTSNIMGNDDEL